VNSFSGVRPSDGDTRPQLVAGLEFRLVRPLPYAWKDVYLASSFPDVTSVRKAFVGSLRYSRSLRRTKPASHSQRRRAAGGITRQYREHSMPSRLRMEWSVWQPWDTLLSAVRNGILRVAPPPGTYVGPDQFKNNVYKT
jgi:hypothetical protein